MSKAKDVYFDRYVLATLRETTDYSSLNDVKRAHGKTVLFSNEKFVVICRKMEGGYVGDILIYTEEA